MGTPDTGEIRRFAQCEARELINRQTNRHFSENRSETFYAECPIGSSSILDERQKCAHKGAVLAGLCKRTVERIAKPGRALVALGRQLEVDFRRLQLGNALQPDWAFGI